MKFLNKRNIFLVFFLILLISVVSYFIALNSDANKFGEQYVRNSDVIENRVGGVLSVRLLPYSYSLKMTFTGGSARFMYKIHGKKGNVEAVLFLSKVDGVWSVSRMRIKD